METNRAVRYHQQAYKGPNREAIQKRSRHITTKERVKRLGYLGPATQNRINQTCFLNRIPRNPRVFISVPRILSAIQESFINLKNLTKDTFTFRLFKNVFLIVSMSSHSLLIFQELPTCISEIFVLFEIIF